MKTLVAIDSATNRCSVALSCQGEIFQEYSDEPRQHGKVLLPMVDTLLQSRGITIAGVDGICVTHGPGSFTGIRVGLSVVQGLMYSTKLPAYAFSTLELMAFKAIYLEGRNQSFSKEKDLVVVPALDARMEEVYFASYTIAAGEAEMINTQAPSLVGVEEFRQLIDKLSAGNQVLGLGPAFSAPSAGAIEQIVFDDAYGPEASTMIHMLNQSTVARDPLTESTSLEPLYLRNEMSWRKRERTRVG